MKKIFILFLIVGSLTSSLVLAQGFGGDKLQNIAQKANLDTDPLDTRVGSIIAGILGLLGTVFLVLTIYAGVLWMTASGEEAKIEKAKDILKAAIIGLAIVMSAYTITYFVGNRLGASGGSDQNTIGCCILIAPDGTKRYSPSSKQGCVNPDPSALSTDWVSGSCPSP